MSLKDNQIEDSVEGCKGCKGFSASEIYSIFHPLIKLYGESYEPIKRAVFFSIIGAVLCDNKISCSDIQDDTRLNLFVPLKSGYGKREIKEVIKQSINQVGLCYCEPTSLHSEQLIGKTVSDKDGKSEVNKGHLADDYLVFEEATELFTEKYNQETRDYLKIALDPIGSNEVYKKSVDTFKENAVRFIPRCTVVFFFQPLSIDDEIVTKGLLRRGIILSVDPNKGERYAALDKSFDEKDVSNNWIQWIDFLKELRTQKFLWSFDEEVKIRINELTKELLLEGFEKGNKASSYTDIMFFTLRNLLVKISCIQTALNGRDKLVVSDVDYAYMDLSSFWKMQLDFVVQKVKGDMDYQDLTNKEKSCLLILMDNGCCSEGSSNLMIKQFIEKISSSIDCTEESAKHYYYGLKESEYIHSRQIGKYGSKVWLTERGNKKIEPYKTLAPLPTLEKKPSIFQRFRPKPKI